MEQCKMWTRDTL